MSNHHAGRADSSSYICLSNGRDLVVVGSFPNDHLEKSGVEGMEFDTCLPFQCLLIDQNVGKFAFT